MRDKEVEQHKNIEYTIINCIHSQANIYNTCLHKMQSLAQQAGGPLIGEMS